MPVSIAPKPSFLSLELRAWRTQAHDTDSEDKSSSTAYVESYDAREDSVVDEITTKIVGLVLDEVDQQTARLTSLRLEDKRIGEPMDVDPLPLVWEPSVTSVPPTISANH